MRDFITYGPVRSATEYQITSLDILTTLYLQITSSRINISFLTSQSYVELYLFIYYTELNL